MRERLSRDVDILVIRLLPDSVDDTHELNNNIYKLQILYNLAKTNSNWLLNNKSIVAKLFDYFNKLWTKKQTEDYLHYQVNSEIILVLKIFVIYCKQNHNDCGLLYKILCVYNQRFSHDLSFLKKFYKYYLP